MATDYSKLKNDELQNLLKQRGLPHSGKKADMVARLQEDDAKEPAGGAASKEDEIDWDDGADATTEPAAAAIAAGGQGRVANPAAVPNQVVAEDPAQTSDLSATVPPKKTAADANGGAAATGAGAEKAEEKPAVDFSSGLALTTEIEELEKRIARGKKFGMGDTDEQKELLKRLERAQKFSTGDAPKGLNEALPERPLGKRRREGGDEGGRGGFKRGGRKPGRGNLGDRRGAREDRPQQAAGGWMNDKDRQAAEARKQRFAAPASS